MSSVSRGTKPARKGQIDLFTKRVRTAMPTAAEFAVHCMVADMLRRLAARDWQWSHLPFGEYRPPATAARLKRMGVMPGWPDFLLLSPGGQPHFLELKREREGRLNDAQEGFAAWCGAHGVAYAVCNRFDAAIHQLTAWGALRARITP